MTLFSDFKSRVIAALDGMAQDGALPTGLEMTRITVELPRDRSHGDLATNAALVLAKAASMKPRDIATELAARLGADPDIEAVEVAGPGFINMTLAASKWRAVLADLIAERDRYGSSGLGGGQKLNVEYVSANPTGPMHVGHCRGAVVGDIIANLMAFTGHDVTREYYINDAGVQVDTVARSAYLRYREALGEDIGPIPDGLYPGDYLVPVGEALARDHGDSLLSDDESQWLPKVRNFAIDAMMDMIRTDLAALNISHDVFFSERSLSSGAANLIAEAIADLRERGLIYEGRLPPPKGQTPEDWEDREQTLFRSTEFGDDVDRALMKSDGSHTYFASDIAYHRNKFQRGFNQMIDIWGADHGGYVKRMKAAVTAITGGDGALEIELCQLVRLFRDGEPIKMSKRAGDFITLRDVVDEVGVDAVRFMMIYRKSDAPLDFDFAKVTEQSKDNPVFYVQYAVARAHSVFRQAGEQFGGEGRPFATSAPDAVDLDALSDAGEVDLIKTLAEFPETVRAAAEHREPHRVAFYLYDLASRFHAQWNRGKDLPQLRFINTDDRKSSVARLALVEGVLIVLTTGLDLLGVTAPETM